MSRLLDGLNKAQAKAVTHGSGPLLIIAGPGTGKTRVISRRYALLVERGAEPESILALAFNNKAAEELRERVDELVEEPHEDLSVTTFHSFCAGLLREESLEAGLDPFFEPVTKADRLVLLLDNLDRIRLRHTETRGNPSAVLDNFLERIDRCKDELVSAGNYRSWAESLDKEATSEGERMDASRELEFAEAFAVHDRLLTESGAVDFGELLVRSVNLLRDNPRIREHLSSRYRHVLVDEFQDTNFAQGALLELLVRDHSNVSVVGDDDQSIYRFRGASRKNILDFQKAFPGTTVVKLERNYRSSQRIVDAAHAVIGDNEERIEKSLTGESAGDEKSVSVWRCQSTRAQAQAVARRIELILATEETEPEEICILIKAKTDAQELVTALNECAVPVRVHRSGGYFNRTEIRDLIAWLRLLLDPADASAVMRILSRAPYELHAADQARCGQIARRRRADMVSALELALEDGQLPAEAAERLKAFLQVHGLLTAQLDRGGPMNFVHKLIELTGSKRQQLFAHDTESVERLLNIAKLPQLAASYARRMPRSDARGFARHLAAISEAGIQEDEADVGSAPPAVKIITMHSAKGLEFDCVFVVGLNQNKMPGSRRSRETVPNTLLKESLPEDTRESHVAEMRRLLYVAMTRARKRLVLTWPERSGEGKAQKPSAFLKPMMEGLELKEEPHEEELFGPAERLHSTFPMLRDELLATVSRLGSELAEMRLDKYMDINHAVARYLELLKLSFLIERSKRQPLAEAMGEVNEMLLQVANPDQRRALLDSSLDKYLLDSEHDERRRRDAIRSKLEPSLKHFLPMRGEGVKLSATDIETYRDCPLKYKFARVHLIPQEQTVPQRFGILFHNVLERFHESSTGEPEPRKDGAGLPRLLDLFDAGWKRSGLGATDDERQLHDKAVAALHQYHKRDLEAEGRPVWLERNFSFQIGPHHLRGRVDRIDKLPDGSYELIDYKTGKPKKKSDLVDDIQLSLYQMGARETWKLETARQSYYYLLDDEKVPVERSEEELELVRGTVTEVGSGILEQDFEPKPSYQTCRLCSFQMICPAVES